MCSGLASSGGNTTTDIDDRPNNDFRIDGRDDVIILKGSIKQPCSGDLNPDPAGY